MRNERHGGGCCGMGHIWDMGIPNSAEKEDRLRMLNTLMSGQAEELSEDGDPEDDYSFLMEVVIIGSQQTFWDAVLKERGFILVNDFINSNTDNTCYIYHLNYTGD